MVCTPPQILFGVKAIRMRCVWHVARVVEMRDVYRVLVAKPEGKRLLRRTSNRWENNIEMDLQEMGCEGMDWTDLDRNRFRAVVNAVMNLRVP